MLVASPHLGQQCRGRALVQEVLMDLLLGSLQRVPRAQQVGYGSCPVIVCRGLCASHASKRARVGGAHGLCVAACTCSCVRACTRVLACEQTPSDMTTCVRYVGAQGLGGTRTRTLGGGGLSGLQERPWIT